MAPPPNVRQFTLTQPIGDNVPDVRATYRRGVLHITVTECPSGCALRLAESLLAEARYILREVSKVPVDRPPVRPQEVEQVAEPLEEGQRDSWVDITTLPFGHVLAPEKE